MVRKEFDLKRFREWLGRVSYKPNVSFRLMVDHELAQLRITIKTLDSSAPENEVLISHTDTIPIMSLVTMEFELFILWVYERVKIMELHEMDEFFRVDKKMRFNPHRE